MFCPYFKCVACGGSFEPLFNDFIFSGYWPGSATNTNYFFDEVLLKFWFHLRHKTPGTSEQKFVESLEEMSLESNRVCVFSL